jgi:flavin-dependent dehydrogenase
MAARTKTTAKKGRGKKNTGPAVVVYGNSPAAVVAALSAKAAKADVVLAGPDAADLQPSGLVTINPELTKLHPSLEGLLDQLPSRPVRRVRFLGPTQNAADTTDAVTPDQTPLALVTDAGDLAKAFRQRATDADVERLAGELSVDEVDEEGLRLRIANKQAQPQLLLAGDRLPDEAAEAVAATRAGRSARTTSIRAAVAVTAGPAVAKEPDVLAVAIDLGADAATSLAADEDVASGFAWGWLLASKDGKTVEAVVQHPAGGETKRVLREWLDRLRAAGFVAADSKPSAQSIRAGFVPLAGALEHDVVARRTLLAGEAGGFVAATGESIYPGCWAAVVAGEVAAKAAKAAQPQDALDPFRRKWGSTLGEYLRGPQQNLRFLLPLVYKNPVMTDRMALAMLRGQSLVY